MKRIVIEDILAKAFECLTVTQYMLENNRLDFAVNRAYFTMYHSVQALLFVKSVRNKSCRRVHSAFHRELILTDELPCELKIILKKTWKKSQRADYIYDKVSETAAIEALTDAELFFNTTVQYLIANNQIQ
jgi:uncharacterized protein (UPF0332 family)